MIPRYIRKAIASWQSWRRRKAMWRAIPQLRELDRQEALCREKHRGGALRIQKARKATVQAVLAGRREREA
jgi:hypothetical protein